MYTESVGTLRNIFWMYLMPKISRGNYQFSSYP